MGVISLTNVALLLGGFALLLGGAELLVRGASKLAATLGVSPLVIGLTVVAFGTSAPEFAVSINAALTGNVDVAVGNVVGSNIANVLLILGFSALISPVAVAQKLVRLDVPLMIGASGLMLAFCWDGRVSQGEGAVLFLLLLAYLGFAVWQSRRERPEVLAEYAAEFGEPPPRTRQAIAIFSGLCLGGLVLLVVGSHLLVRGAVQLAEALGVSSLVIGLTVVAVGTSLPELATSAVASLRNENDIAAGNVVGSSIFNILGVLGLSAFVTPQGLAVNPAALAFDIPVMIATAVVCLPIFFTGYTIWRWEGAVLMGYFAAYVTYLALDASRQSALEDFDLVMRWIVVPLTAAVLLISFLVDRRRRVR